MFNKRAFPYSSQSALLVIVGLGLGLGVVMWTKLSWLPHTRKVHSGKVLALTFTSDGRQLDSIGADKALVFSDTMLTPTRRRRLNFLVVPERAAFARDGQTFAVAAVPQMRLYETMTGKPYWTGTIVLKDAVTAFAVMPHGDGLAINDTSDAGAGLFWCSKTGQPVKTPDFAFLFDDDLAWSAAYSPNGARFAAANGHTIGVWHVGARRLLWKQLAPDKVIDPTTTLEFSPDGKLLASGFGTGQLYLWDATTGKLLHSLHGQPQIVEALAFSPDSAMLASGGESQSNSVKNNDIQLWDTHTGQELSTLKLTHGAVNSLAFAPDGNALASGYSDGTVALWRIR